MRTAVSVIVVLANFLYVLHSAVLSLLRWTGGIGFALLCSTIPDVGIRIGGSCTLHVHQADRTTSMEFSVLNGSSGQGHQKISFTASAGGGESWVTDQTLYIPVTTVGIKSYSTPIFEKKITLRAASI